MPTAQLKPLDRLAGISTAPRQGTETEEVGARSYERSYGRENQQTMSISYSSVVDAPIDEVFAWHARPGALTRLSPPWQPVRAGQEATSLRDGRAVLLLPGGARWVAPHRAGGAPPPRQFVDQLVASGLTSSALARVLTWRHVHGF